MSEEKEMAFVVKMSKFGKRRDGETRRCFIVPSEKTKDAVDSFEGKQVKIIIKEI